MNQGWSVPFATAAALVGLPAYAQEDPGALGSHSVTVSSYGSQTTLVKDVSAFDVNNETMAQVVYPTDVANGPYPLVLFVHGRHFSCYSAQGTFPWPCNTAGGIAPWPSHEGYLDAATQLASHGMVVVSISAHGVSSVSSAGDSWEQLIQYHMTRWQAFSSGAAIGNGQTFAGKVDLTRVGLMGHSRGGEAVLEYTAASPANVHAVMAIAPAGINTATPITNIPLVIMLAYCDGDTEDLSGVGHVDSTRYVSATDNSPKYTIMSLGANHNNFNSAWTPGFGLDASLGYNEDDWDNSNALTSPATDQHCASGAAGRITDAQQRGFRTAYLSAFFRRYLHQAKHFDSLLKGDQLPPPSALTDDVYIGYLPGANDRKDLNRQAASTDITSNALGGNVTFTSGVTRDICSGSSCRPGLNRSTHFGNASALKVSWGLPGQRFSNVIAPPNRDVSNFSSLQFRVAVASATPRDFSVRLEDGTGRSSKLRASDYTDVLDNAPGDPANRALVMNTVRIPLSAFAGVDMTSVASVDVVLDQQPAGSLLFADFAFADEGVSISEKWLVSAG